MKKLSLLIIMMLVNFIACKAQETIPIEKEWDYLNSLPKEENAPDGTYYKDVNNTLDKYEGLWKVTLDDMVYEIDIEKYTRESLGIKKDALLIHYKIAQNSDKNANGEIKGRGFIEEDNTIYKASYVGEDAGCGDAGAIFLDISDDKKSMELYILPSESIITVEKCPNGLIEPPFPDETETPMTLTKQE